jgi:hypothetical protein
MRIPQVVPAIILNEIDAETIMRQKGEMIGKLGRVYIWRGMREMPGKT